MHKMSKWLNKNWTRACKIELWSEKCFGTFLGVTQRLNGLYEPDPLVSKGSLAQPRAGPEKKAKHTHFPSGPELPVL